MMNDLYYFLNNANFKRVIFIYILKLQIEEFFTAHDFFFIKVLIAFLKNIFISFNHIKKSLKYCFSVFLSLVFYPKIIKITNQYLSINIWKRKVK